MAHLNCYALSITAGPTYDMSTHEQVPVNSLEAVNMETERVKAQVRVRIKNYRGLPHRSPPSSEYFSHPSRSNARYSISFSFTPKHKINGEDLQFGNNLDHPIRHKLPRFTDKAFSILKRWIDPGLDGDPYADEPYLYGPLLSSINILRIGRAIGDDILEEGAEGDSATAKREEQAMPADAGARMKYFLKQQKREDFDFEPGEIYSCDFFNPYVDFSDMAIKLPMGITIDVIKRWEGEPLRDHTLRYVLKQRSNDEPLFVICFNLVPAEYAESRTPSCASSTTGSASTSATTSEAPSPTCSTPSLPCLDPEGDPWREKLEALLPDELPRVGVAGRDCAYVD